jgi:hypothetical protein
MRMISRRCGGRVVGCIEFRAWRSVDRDRDEMEREYCTISSISLCNSSKLQFTISTKQPLAQSPLAQPLSPAPPSLPAEPRYRNNNPSIANSANTPMNPELTFPRHKSISTLPVPPHPNEPAPGQWQTVRPEAEFPGDKAEYCAVRPEMGCRRGLAVRRGSESMLKGSAGDEIVGGVIGMS